MLVFIDRLTKGVSNAYEVPSPNSKELMKVFHRICKENEMMATPQECFEFMQTIPDRYRQMSFFDDFMN